MLHLMKFFTMTSFALAATIAFPVLAQDQSDKTSLKDYLVDLGSGAISASSLVGVSGSAIHNIQSPQDLLVAFNPASGANSKSGFAISLTPGRTSFFPISGKLYSKNQFYRLLGGTSVSYAENKATIAGAGYKKTAVSIETVFYPEAKNDPMIYAYNAFVLCDQTHDITKATMDLAVEIGLETNSEKKLKLIEAMPQIKKATEDKLLGCKKAADIERQEWNTTKISVSYGAGRIRADNGGATESLGRVLAANAVIKAGKDGAVNLSARRTMNEVDLKTLGKTPVNQNATLVAARFTMGLPEAPNWRALAEVSNNSTSTQTSTTATYKSAVGMDVRVQKGMWLELRYGKMRSLDNGKTENKALMTFNWSPTSTLPKE